MARSRKKSSARPASNAKAKDKAKATEKAAADPVEDLVDETADPTSEASHGKRTTSTADAKDPAPRKRGGKDPVKRSAATGKDTASPQGGEVTEKAKDSTRSTSVKKAAAAESTRSTGRRVAAANQTPSWLAPTAVVFLVLGLLYLVTYYLSSGQLPLPIGDWNLAAGFGVLMVGGGMLMFWK